jgi:serine/threonine protein phosphatase 1
MELTLIRQPSQMAAPDSNRDRRLPATEAGHRLYAIGDIHGCYDLLIELLGKIEQHASGLPEGPSPRIVLLGDLIDRGPDSPRVLRFVHALQERTADLTVLMGNHEAMMIDAVAGRPGALKAWMRLGGETTLRGLGIDPPQGNYLAREYATALRSAIPSDQLEWLAGLPTTFRSGDYLFCHAGVRPGVALKRQTRHDLLWIRSDFLSDAGDHGAVVVHGHSVVRAVEVRHNRIGIDTGAYHSGTLSALYLEGDRREIISTGEIEARPLPRTRRLTPA